MHEQARSLAAKPGAPIARAVAGAIAETLARLEAQEAAARPARTAEALLALGRAGARHAGRAFGRACRSRRRRRPAPMGAPRRARSRSTPRRSWPSCSRGRTRRCSPARAQAEGPAISVVDRLEAALRLDRPDSAAATRAFESFLLVAGLAIVPATPSQGRPARLAYARFGKGRHPAGPSVGDRVACALAREAGRPLLYEGGGFARTDIASALEGRGWRDHR